MLLLRTEVRKKVRGWTEESYGTVEFTRSACAVKSKQPYFTVEPVRRICSAGFGHRRPALRYTYICHTRAVAEENLCSPQSWTQITRFYRFNNGARAYSKLSYRTNATRPYLFKVNRRSIQNESFCPKHIVRVFKMGVKFISRWWTVMFIFKFLFFISHLFSWQSPFYPHRVF